MIQTQLTADLGFATQFYVSYVMIKPVFDSFFNQVSLKQVGSFKF